LCPRHSPDRGQRNRPNRQPQKSAAKKCPHFVLHRIGATVAPDLCHACSRRGRNGSFGTKPDAGLEFCWRSRGDFLPGIGRPFGLSRRPDAGALIVIAAIALVAVLGEVARRFSAGGSSG
jgi:hypothetical protein